MELCLYLHLIARVLQCEVKEILVEEEINETLKSRNVIRSDLLLAMGVFTRLFSGPN